MQPNLPMVISYTIFLCCMGSDGGVIRYDSISSDLRFVCGSFYAINYGHFCYIVTNEGAFNYFISITNSSYNNDNEATLSLENGIHTIKNMNSSMNNARDGSSFECYSSLSILCIYSTLSH